MTQQTRGWGTSLVGQRFGRLLVLFEDKSRDKHVRLWRCRCDCGKEWTVSHGKLRGGATQSCGCLRREVSRARSTKHGHSVRGNRTKSYESWASMRARCNTPSASGYEYYGAIGITWDSRWDTFEAFLSDMGERPPGMSLDRIDSSKGYGPDNCRWATRQQQNENRRSVRWIEHAGKRLTIAGWARKLGVAKSTLYEALEKHPIEVALRDRLRAANDEGASEERVAA